jgi:hypothetical protein
MENLIVSDLRTKADLRFRLISEMALGNFVGYMTVVRPIDGRFDSVDITLFFDLDGQGNLRATVEIYEFEEVHYLPVAEDETTLSVLTRVRDFVTSVMASKENVEELCAAFLNAGK